MVIAMAAISGEHQLLPLPAPATGTIGDQIQQLVQEEGADLLVLIRAATIGDSAANARATVGDHEL
jgi:hypothetical protein